MLTLITGQPGNGKTLWTLKTIHERAQREGRPVFYSGIELTDQAPFAGDWTALGDLTAAVEVTHGEGTTEYRYRLPPNALVVIDEAQRVFRVRSQGAKVPPHVAAMETHRHEGIDFFLLTQSPKLIDTNIRELAGYHVHLVRRSGLASSNVYEWEQVETNPRDAAAQKNARHSKWSFATEYFAYYKSAEVHTHQRNLPWKQISAAVAAAAVVIAGIAYTVYHVTSGAGVVMEAAEVGGQDGVTPMRQAVADNPWNAGHRAPRVSGWERTAPLYDELQKAVSQPKVSGCMRLAIDADVRCKCTSSQGSVLALTGRECSRLIEDGWFDETREEISAKEENIRYLNARDSNGGEQGPPQAATAAAASPATSS